jgi:hypothetical protein
MSARQNDASAAPPDVSTQADKVAVRAKLISERLPTNSRKRCHRVTEVSLVRGHGTTSRFSANVLKNFRAGRPPTLSRARHASESAQRRDRRSCLDGVYRWPWQEVVEPYTAHSEACREAGNTHALLPLTRLSIPLDKASWVESLLIGCF